MNEVSQEWVIHTIFERAAECKSSFWEIVEPFKGIPVIYNLAIPFEVSIMQQ